MRHLFLFIAALTSSLCYAQEWSLIDTGAEVQLNAIHFIDDNTGFIAGNTGTLLRTTDGGANWETIETGITNNIWDITFVDENTGYAPGLKTIDGGDTWEIQSSTADFIFMHAIDENHLLANYPSASNAVYDSFDGGETWTANNEDGLDGIGGVVNDCHFVSEDIGYLSAMSIAFTPVGVQSILKTVDGGVSWNLLSVDAPAGYPFDNAFSAVDFITENTGILAHENGVVKTTDGGETWTEILSPFVPSSWEASEVHALTEDHYIAIGGMFFDENENAKLYETMDGGVTWTAAAFTNGVLFGTTCTSTNCFSVGWDGELYRKFDDAPNSLADHDRFEFSIFPNPTSDYLQVDAGDQRISSFEVIDLNGRRCTTPSFDGRRVDVSRLETGLYFLTISIGGEEVVSRFMKE